MYFYLKLTRWNRTKLISGFSQWSAKTWLMLLTRGALLLTFREQSSRALQIYFCTHKIHFTIYPYPSPLHRNAWHTCHPHTYSMTKPPEENVVWLFIQHDFTEAQRCFEKENLLLCICKTFQCLLAGQLGQGTIWKLPESAENCGDRLFSDIFFFYWVSFSLDSVQIECGHAKNPENKSPNNHNKIRSMPIPIEAEVVDVRW